MCVKYLNIQSLPKSFPNEFQEKSWEDAAANLALKVAKLEKKVEELIIKHTSDPNYKYFLEHGKWPWRTNYDYFMKNLHNVENNS